MVLNQNHIIIEVEFDIGHWLVFHHLSFERIGKEPTWDQRL
ncbi:hypothetical protein SAMN04488694_12219 [Natrinema hispanicum]|uniref:Uncharacterized protein n=1 Tax=Natrinema hispanicum TaxID=392421 RepID=A0A1I0IKQ5_9EURY|nr:hypothetical protein SAMN04488694_12219 [Natrinema hispanicum]